MQKKTLFMRSGRLFDEPGDFKLLFLLNLFGLKYILKDELAFTKIVHNKVHSRKLDSEVIEARYKLGLASENTGFDAGSDEDCKTSFTSLEPMPDMAQEQAAEAEYVMEGINEVNEQLEQKSVKNPQNDSSMTQANMNSSRVDQINSLQMDTLDPKKTPSKRQMLRQSSKVLRKGLTMSKNSLNFKGLGISSLRKDQLEKTNPPSNKQSFQDLQMSIDQSPGKKAEQKDGLDFNKIFNRIN